MELYHYILIALAVIFIYIFVLIYFSKEKESNKKEYDLDAIFKLLDKDNINKIEYLRNKIVINFKDVTLFKTEELHEKGALGVTIVGDKVKFYFDGGNDKNYTIFNELKSYIEG